MSERDLLERLAELEHDQWIAWSRNIAETEQITPARLERWRKLWRPYAELTEAEKDLDREWAREALAIIKQRERELIEKAVELARRVSPSASFYPLLDEECQHSVSEVVKELLGESGE